eukprot:CAMPEP_0178431142 /NCGR_PEP_ID=MMETSP0689_2-20121128/31685_1 /TAXON_ID=160604 /ORGANISM="Amphidinium massartii, Strain CS-259" /LENGTH=131 /DNA_ID=CAMNT_0020053025 /DNA_START=208 /DNA_END=599 /DNA_ORIENTATION=+
MRGTENAIELVQQEEQAILATWNASTDAEMEEAMANRAQYADVDAGSAGMQDRVAAILNATTVVPTATTTASPAAAATSAAADASPTTAGATTSSPGGEVVDNSTNATTTSAGNTTEDSGTLTTGASWIAT